MSFTPKNIFFSSSPKETAKLARLVVGIAKKKARKNRRGAFIFALFGNLGAGKTVFAKALLQALGVKETVASPTFVLSREYLLSRGAYKKAYHIDVYRLSAKETHVLELPEIFKEKNSLVLIEWADKIRRLMPQSATWIYFSHGKKLHERKIEIR